MKIIAQAEIPVFTQVEDKKMTLHKLRKALMQGRFFYVGRLSHFALWRINGSAPRQIAYSHSIVDGGLEVTS